MALEAAQRKVQDAVREFVDNIDRTKLRPIQKSMYLCNAECMSDPSASMEEVGCTLIALLIRIKTMIFNKRYGF